MMVDSLVPPRMVEWEAAQIEAAVRGGDQLLTSAAHMGHIAAVVRSLLQRGRMVE